MVAKETQAPPGVREPEYHYTFIAVIPSIPEDDVEEETHKSKHNSC